MYANLYNPSSPANSREYRKTVITTIILGILSKAKTSLKRIEVGSRTFCPTS